MNFENLCKLVAYITCFNYCNLLIAKYRFIPHPHLQQCNDDARNPSCRIKYNNNNKIINIMLNVVAAGSPALARVKNMKIEICVDKCPPFV